MPKGVAFPAIEDTFLHAAFPRSGAEVSREAWLRSWATFVPDTEILP
jgi:hypothetical protein